MIALEGNFAYSFILGIMAAVNPCGFVLLPTYLVYYLGTELNREDENKTTTLRRGLSVGIAVSSGFIGLFLIVGIISRAFTTVIRDNAKYAALVIGIALVAISPQAACSLQKTGGLDGGLRPPNGASIGANQSYNRHSISG